LGFGFLIVGALKERENWINLVLSRPYRAQDFSETHAPGGASLALGSLLAALQAA